MGADKEDFQQAVEDENVLISQIIKMGFDIRLLMNLYPLLSPKKRSLAFTATKVQGQNSPTKLSLTQDPPIGDLTSHGYFPLAFYSLVNKKQLLPSSPYFNKEPLNHPSLNLRKLAGDTSWNSLDYPPPLATTCHHCNFVYFLFPVALFTEDSMVIKQTLWNPHPYSRRLSEAPEGSSHILCQRQGSDFVVPLLSLSFTYSHCLSRSFTEKLFTYLKVHPLRSILSMFTKLCNRHYSSF